VVLGQRPNVGFAYANPELLATVNSWMKWSQGFSLDFQLCVDKVEKMSNL
jgi:hypothetical protein